MIRINRLTAEEWLRLLREQPLVNYPVRYCSTCEAAEVSTSTLPCECCHTPMIALDDAFWRTVSRKLRRSYQQDHGLFARIKAEFPSWPFASLSEPLGWVSSEWRRARRLRGKPPEIEKRLFVVSWVRKLSQPHFTIEVGDPLETSTPATGTNEPIVTITQISGPFTVDLPTHKMRVVEHPPHMSLTLALSVMFDEEPEFLTRGFLGVRRKWKHYSQGELRELGKQFREEFSQRFGGVPSRDRREIERAIRWAYRLAPDPTFRIRGNAPRARGARRK